MRAVIFTQSGEKVVDHDPPGAPGPGEVLLEVAYCGICGSDLHAGEPDFRPGTIMGHEFSATVIELGEGVVDLVVGDRVVVNPNGAWCGRCRACRRGEVNMCENVWDTAIGLAQNGGLATTTIVPARVAHRLPDTVDLQAAALIEPLSVALRAVRTSGIRIGEEAIVFGGGPIGLLVTAVLKSAGASAITVVEPNPARRDVAVRLGATTAIDPSVTPAKDMFPDPFAAPRYAFECSGVAELVGVAAAVLRPHGIVTVTGFSRRPPTFDAADLLFKEIAIRGSFIYVDEFTQAIALLADGRVDVAPLITGVVRVDDAHVAFDRMRHSPDAIKYLITALPE